MAFGLQFLNGIGDTYDAPIMRENIEEQTTFNLPSSQPSASSMPQQQNMIMNMEMQNEITMCNAECTKTRNMLTATLWLAIGMVAGQVVKKIFTEKPKKKED